MKETIVKINTTKTWFSEKRNKINKPLARLIKNKKKENNQINKTRNEKEEVTTYNAELHRILREYYEQLYTNKMNNLEETDRFLEKFNLPRLNQEEIEITNKPITNTEIKTMITNLTKNKSPGLDGFTGEFYQTFTEELMSIFLKLFQKITEEGTLSNSFFEAIITLIPKLGKDNTQNRKLTNLQPDSTRKKKRRIKLTKLEMKEQRLQQTMQKYKGL